MVRMVLPTQSQFLRRVCVRRSVHGPPKSLPTDCVKLLSRMLTSLAVCCVCLAQGPNYVDDLKDFIRNLRESGAYASQDKIDFNGLERAYESQFRQAKTQTDALRVLEDLVGELHDAHAGLGVNDGHSPRLVPTGTDLYASWRHGKAVIGEVRLNTLAAQAGILAGDEVVSIDEAPVQDACNGWLHVRRTDPRAMDWALNSALAGRWDMPRHLILRRQGRLMTFDLKTASNDSPKTALKVEHRSGGVLYLRPENSLGDFALVTAIDHARKDIVKAKRIVIDLRNTPSGGDSSVARAILGHFVRSRKPFQRHTFFETDTNTIHDWVEYANPRFTDVARGKVAVLVDHWTGSMGEGIAIGMDATGAGMVIGTPMAGLRGAISGFELPVSKYRVQFPTEKIYHLNGTPREFWKPKLSVNLLRKGDPWMTSAMRFFH